MVYTSFKMKRLVQRADNALELEPTVQSRAALRYLSGNTSQVLRTLMAYRNQESGIAAQKSSPPVFFSSPKSYLTHLGFTAVLINANEIKKVGFCQTLGCGRRVVRLRKFPTIDNGMTPSRAVRNSEIVGVNVPVINFTCMGVHKRAEILVE